MTFNDKLKKYVVIWDWDNTLIDSKVIVKQVLLDLTDHFGIPMLTDDEIQELIGTHLSHFWFQFKGHMAEALAYYQEGYTRSASTVQPFYQAQPILEFLLTHNIPQMIASNKRQITLDAECQHLGWSHYFKAVRGIDARGQVAKPDKRFVASALQDIDYTDIIVVGDGQSDMELAHQLNAVYIAVHNPSLADKADIYCSDLVEVYQRLSCLITAKKDMI